MDCSSILFAYFVGVYFDPSKDVLFRIEEEDEGLLRDLRSNKNILLSHLFLHQIVLLEIDAENNEAQNANNVQAMDGKGMTKIFCVFKCNIITPKNTLTIC